MVSLDQAAKDHRLAEVWEGCVAGQTVTVETLRLALSNRSASNAARAALAWKLLRALPCVASGRVRCPDGVAVGDGVRLLKAARDGDAREVSALLASSPDP
eukprot:Hpha_TRINITY_DN20803_c0_g1::TRINITY_DN20803_c0_g1_i1::g.85623::m.85623